MAKLTVGSQMPDFTFAAPFEAGRTMLNTAGRVKGRTAVVFLRYFGCPLCANTVCRNTPLHMTALQKPTVNCWLFSNLIRTLKNWKLVFPTDDFSFPVLQQFPYRQLLCPLFA